MVIEIAVGRKVQKMNWSEAAKQDAVFAPKTYQKLSLKLSSIGRFIILQSCRAGIFHHNSFPRLQYRGQLPDNLRIPVLDGDGGSYFSLIFYSRRCDSERFFKPFVGGKQISDYLRSDRQIGT